MRFVRNPIASWILGTVSTGMNRNKQRDLQLWYVECFKRLEACQHTVVLSEANDHSRHTKQHWWAESVLITQSAERDADKALTALDIMLEELVSGGVTVFSNSRQFFFQRNDS